MKYILLVLTVLVATGCTITAKEPRDELVARNAALSAEVKSNEKLREIIQWMQEQKSEARSQQFNEWIQSRSAGGLGDTRCNGGSFCGGPPVSTQPIYQPQPSQPIIVIPPQPPSIQPMPPQQPQQPIFIQPMPSQPTIQPIPQQPPVWIQPVPPVSTMPVPPQGGPNCYWRADGQGNFVWMCAGGPISYPIPPGQGTPVIQNPQDFNEKQ